MFEEEKKVKADYEQCENCKKFRDRLYTVKPLPNKNNPLDFFLGGKTRKVCKDCIERENRK